jgi:polyisoprenoid-binding protein YceI
MTTTMKTTMKTLLLLTIVLVGTAFTANPIERKDIKEGTITWTGKKIIGSHTGTINLTSGYLEMDGDALVGGMFEVDMTSITNTDLDPDYQAKLVGHLKSSDFFAVEEFPTATLVIKDVQKKENTYNVMGDLTIKGITETVNFEIVMSTSAASATVVIDRTKFGIRYGSGDFFDNLGDKAISNNFELDVMIKF